MKFAIVGDNKHQKPSKGARGVCPLCGEILVARCGITLKMLYNLIHIQTK